MSTKTITCKVHVFGATRVTLHCAYRGFQQCFLVCSTDAQIVAPVGNVHPWNVVIWVVSCLRSMRKTNPLTVSTMGSALAHSRGSVSHMTFSNPSTNITNSRE